MIYLVLLYWISRGVTEGLKWSERKFSASEYHLWRLVECIAIYALLVIKYGWQSPTAGFLIGIFIYERVLMKLHNGKWFKDEGTIFDIGIKVKRYKWQDYLILATGIGVLFV